jgi:hypothetical protein
LLFAAVHIQDEEIAIKMATLLIQMGVEPEKKD